MGYGLAGATPAGKPEARTVVLASADTHFRSRLRQQLTAMRWHVREASGGADAIAQLEAQAAEAMVLDSMLPDLEVGEFASQIRHRHPVMDLLRVDAGMNDTGPRSPRRNELLHALRQALEEAQGSAAPDTVSIPKSRNHAFHAQPSPAQRSLDIFAPEELPPAIVPAARGTALSPSLEADRPPARPRTAPLPGMVGESPAMIELARMVRLVAPRSTSVLIEGETGTGKELVAKAVHLLSARANKPYVVLNCAAIPETLLEAELFGHTRGAFTGAVQSRTGRIEAANGGTLFLDEIGEMPLALQAKMLRFLESGELQRVGDNETIRVDVRIVSATHQHLRQQTADHTFRLDLYHRLAVFPVFLPPLRDRVEDVLPLAAHLLGRLGEDMPVKRLSALAAQKLTEHDWPGNVRCLAHVLERGTILAEDRPEIGLDEIRF
jgi:DNA-binding NtrC family response regulator